MEGAGSIVQAEQSLGSRGSHAGARLLDDHSSSEEERPEIMLDSSSWRSWWARLWHNARLEDKFRSFDTYVFRPFVQGAAWGMATHATALLMSSLWYQRMGIHVCARCGEQQRIKEAPTPSDKQ